jgi:hypothetical protein
VRIRGEYGSDEFLAAYKAAMSASEDDDEYALAIRAAKKLGLNRVTVGNVTFEW